MSEESYDQLPLPDDDMSIGKAAVVRYYAEIGRRLEYLQTGIVNARAYGLFVYQLQIRWPKKVGDEHLCIAKMLSVDGSHIAFTSGENLISALGSTGSRLRSGSLEWLQDEYPPEDAVTRLAWMSKHLYTPHRDVP